MPSQPTTVTYRRAPGEKRERLLRAAQELFANQGFEHTSTQQIARHAGVSEGILFHHFGTKRGLFESVAEDFVRAGVQATMPLDTADATEEDVVRAAFDFADANPAFYKVLAEVSAASGEPGPAVSSEVIVEAIRQRLEDAMAAGIVRRGNARIMAQLQLVVVDGAYRTWLMSGEPSLREEYIQEAVRCLQAMLGTGTI